MASEATRHGIDEAVLNWIFLLDLVAILLHVRMLVITIKFLCLLYIIQTRFPSEILQPETLLRYSMTSQYNRCAAACAYDAVVVLVGDTEQSPPLECYVMILGLVLIVLLVSRLAIL